jgi:mRNA-decapping enzyme subunit 2
LYAAHDVDIIPRDAHADYDIGLDDLCVRFIINLPQEDLSSVARICFQVEEAQWFYEDFIRPLDPTLPSMTLRTFCLRMFQHCPLLASFSVENHTQAFEEFLQYKTRVPVRGAILLNSEMDSTVLVKGWKKGANWSFPRGKINKDEDDLDCAIREVYEETGLDLRAAGLVPKENKPKYIEISMREQQLRLYVFRDVPMDTHFAPRTRKEISKIEWYKLSELPAFRRKGAADDAGNPNTNNTNANKFYMVAPFLVPLKKWVLTQKRHDSKRAANAHANLQHHMSVDEGITEDDAYIQPEPMMQHQMPGPAAHALESATQELQRLLKVQPPTQGLQTAEVSQSDKGSALLSILQPRSNGAAQYQQQYQNHQQHQHQQEQQQQGHVPHTPLDHVFAQAPQPRNPHHHNNAREAPVNPQQMPPSFPLGHGQQPASWQYSNQQAGPPQMPPQPAWPFLPQHQQPQQPSYASQPVNLVHPQPLPPQVQRAIFNQSAFQESSQQGGHGAAPAVQQQQQPQQQQQQFAQHAQHPPQQQHQAAPAPGGAPLTGQSMALLNAFKRAPAVASNENERQNPHSHPFPQQQQPQQQHHQAAPPVQAHLGQLAVPSYTNPPPTAPTNPSNLHHQTGPGPVVSPKELAGIGVIPQKADHRNALLGMFKSPTTKHASPSPATTTQQQTPPTHLIPTLSNLSISPNSQNTPPRILKRGQDPSSSLSQSSISPATRPIQPQQQQQQQAPPAAQKSQLLSLFGKQQAPTSSAGPNSPLAGSSSIASQEDRKTGPASAAGSNMSRRGSETPISPADQNFLLGYLQSVTNNATASR